MLHHIGVERRKNGNISLIHEAFNFCPDLVPRCLVWSWLAPWMTWEGAVRRALFVEGMFNVLSVIIIKSLEDVIPYHLEGKVWPQSRNCLAKVDECPFLLYVCWCAGSAWHRFTRP